LHFGNAILQYSCDIEHDILDFQSRGEKNSDNKPRSNYKAWTKVVAAYKELTCKEAGMVKWIKN
jgi:hypothetical protein